MAQNDGPLDIAPPRYNSASPRNQTSNLTSALQEAGPVDYSHSVVQPPSTSNVDGRSGTSFSKHDTISNGFGSSHYGSGARPITMKERPRRESNTGSFMAGLSWGGVSVGSWIRDDILMTGTSPAMNQSPSFHSSSYLPKMEANFMKDFTCCGLVLDSLHDLLQHFEETHTQASTTTQRSAQAVQNDMESASRESTSQGLSMEAQPSSSTEHPTSGQAGFRPSSNAHSTQSFFRSHRLGSDGFNKTNLSTVQDMDTLEDMELDDTGDLPPIEERQSIETQPLHRPDRSSLQPTSPQNFVDESNNRGLQLNISIANSLQNQNLRSSNPSTPSAGHQAFGLQNNPTVSSVNTPTLGTHSALQGNRTPDSSIPGTPSELDTDIPSGVLTNQSKNNIGSGGEINWISGGTNGFDGTIDQPAKRLFSKQSSGPSHHQLQQAFRTYQSAGTSDDSEITKRLQEQQFLANMTQLGFQEEPKPFKCPVIGCEKAYKNQNGLKYHKAHGHQNQQLKSNEDGTFSIVDPVTSIPYPGTIGMEKEKPYRCDTCGKRYKNLNGLKYHRQHSPQCNPDLKMNPIGLNRGPMAIGTNLQGLNVNANVAGAGLTGMNDSGIF